ncbi:MAG: PTS sugar transporter subunit IIA [Candidatus Glassbacteria bacterium]|nr:PTS sugar transporter subunit IIA [Candidatus Glassbacteria bacterium]
MKLMDFVSEKTIDPELEGKNKSELLSRMVEMLHQAGKIENPEPLLKSLLEREKIMTTGIGRGIAVPHAMNPEAKQLIIALGRIPGGADFESLDRKPVYFIFLLVGPPESSGQHLRTLARISRLVQHSQFVESIKKARDARAILRILAEEDAKHTG